MEEIVNTDPKYESIRDKCKNIHTHCTEWAIGTGCDDNPRYMKYKCAPACQSCNLVLEKAEMCKFDPGPNAIEKGGLNELFERMVNVADEKGFHPKVWSRPAKNYSTSDDVSDQKRNSCASDVTNPCDTPDGPWVLTLENFLSSAEIEAMLKWGSKKGYERSQAGDAILDVRTSSQAWCVDDCHDDSTVATVRQRIEDVTGVPQINYEYLQLLKYEVGQFYKAHNDYIVKHKDQPHGPRLLTFFIYFNEVEEGGGTQFPELNNLTIEPRKGRVLIWPSVKDDDPDEEDFRTDHEALAVIKGRKFAANAWVHMRDFKTGYKLGCDS